MVAPNQSGRLWSFLIVWISLVLYSPGLDAILVANDTVACPGDVVTIICTVTGSLLTWMITSPDSSIAPVESTIRSNVAIDTPVTIGTNTEFQFSIARIADDMGSLRSTLTTVSNISCLNGTVVTCTGQGQGPFTIQVADPPTPPQNPILVFQNGTDTSVVMLQWSPPSPTSGVDVSYVVTVSPPPPLEQTVTTQTSLVEITVAYNTLYSVTIRAENCAGPSGDTVVMFELVNCLTPSASDPVVLEDVPSVTTEGTTLTIRCPGVDSVISTCESNGRWSPDPTDYDCMIPTTPTPITCGPPQPPLNGSVNNGVQSLTYVEGIALTFQCNDGLFPNETMSITCGSNGVWEPDPASVTCRDRPVNCSFPGNPENGTILDYDNISTIEGSVITFQCNPGLSPEGVMTATCTNDGVWSPDPADVVCRNITGIQPQSVDVTGIAVGVVFSLLIVTVIIIVVVTGTIVCLLRRGKPKEGEVPSTLQNTTTAGPVYDDVILPPREEHIELETNQAYGHLRRY